MMLQVTVPSDPNVYVTQFTGQYMGQPWDYTLLTKKPGSMIANNVASATDLQNDLDQGYGTINLKALCGYFEQCRDSH